MKFDNKIKNLKVNEYIFEKIMKNKKMFVIPAVAIVAASFSIPVYALNQKIAAYDKVNYSIYCIDDSTKDIKKKKFDIFVYDRKINSLSDSENLIKYFETISKEHDCKIIYLDLDKCIDINDNNSYKYIEFIINRCRSNNIYVSIMGSEDSLSKRNIIYDYNGICLKYNDGDEFNGSCDYTSLYNVKKNKYYVTKKYNEILKNGNINAGNYFYEDELYEIQNGEYLILIAEKYSMKLDDLISYNNITNIDMIPAGTIIKIPYEYSQKKGIVIDSSENDLKEIYYESYVVASEYINVRDGAGLNGSIIGNFHEGDIIKVITADGKYSDDYHWVEIIFDDNMGTLKRGWVAKENIAKFEVKNEVNNDYNQDSIYSDSAIVLNLDDNSVLFEKNIHEKCEPASITKVLTAYIVYKYGNLNDDLIYSNNAVSVEGHYSEGYGSGCDFVYSRNKISVNDALHVSLFLSDNATTVALQEYIEKKTGRNFIELMNETAKKIGCLDSNFTNSYGYEDPNHITTAYDMALITSHIAKDAPDVIEIMGSKSYELGIGEIISNQSALVQNNDEVIGCKSGYTDRALQTMITLFKKDDKTIVVVTLHCDDFNYRDNDAITLSEIGFSKLGILNTDNNELLDSNKFCKIVDISEHQGNISLDDYEIMKKKSDAIIIRLGDAEKVACSANGYINYLDDQFFDNMEKANEMNIKKGIYFFSRATDMTSAQQEINFINDMLNELRKKDISLQLPVYLDIEDVRTKDDDNHDRLLSSDETVAKNQRNIIDYICSSIEKEGYLSGIYINYCDINALCELSTNYSMWGAGGDYYDIETNIDNLRESYIYDTKIELSENIPIMQSCEYGIIDDVSFDNGAIDLNYADRKYFNNLVEDVKQFNKR